MNNKWKQAVAVVGTIQLMVCAARADVILNGDFEVPVQPVNAFLPAGSTMEGWAVTGSGGVTIHQVHQPYSLWAGKALSDQFMDLTGNGGRAGIISTPFATLPGQQYAVTFEAFNGSLVWNQGQVGVPWQGNILSVQVNNNARVMFTSSDIPADNTTRTLTYYFTAGAQQTSTWLTFYDETLTDSNAGWIDNVALTAVPEPTTVIAGALLLLPLGASALRILRTKSSR